MSTSVDSKLTVPKYESDGSVAAVALGGAVTLTAGGWVSNNGPTMIFLVGTANAAAREDPASYGVGLPQNTRLWLPAGIQLADYGLLAENVAGVAAVLGT